MDRVKIKITYIGYSAVEAKILYIDWYNFHNDIMASGIQFNQIIKFERILEASKLDTIDTTEEEDE